MFGYSRVDLLLTPEIILTCRYNFGTFATTNDFQPQIYCLTHFYVNVPKHKSLYKFTFCQNHFYKINSLKVIFYHGITKHTRSQTSLITLQNIKFKQYNKKKNIKTNFKSLIYTKHRGTKHTQQQSQLNYITKHELQTRTTAK